MVGRTSASSARNASSSAMRLPLVLSMTWRMARALAARIMAMICGWIEGSPPANCTISGAPSVATRWSRIDRKSTRLNSSHTVISYAVFCLKKKKNVAIADQLMRTRNISQLVIKAVVRTEGNTAVGMFTNLDVVRSGAEHAQPRLDINIVDV